MKWNTNWILILERILFVKWYHLFYHIVSGIKGNIFWASSFSLILCTYGLLSLLLFSHLWWSPQLRGRARGIILCPRTWTIRRRTLTFSCMEQRAAVGDINNVMRSVYTFPVFPFRSYHSLSSRVVPSTLPSFIPYPFLSSNNTAPQYPRFFFTCLFFTPLPLLCGVWLAPILVCFVGVCVCGWVGRYTFHCH